MTAAEARAALEELGLSRDEFVDEMLAVTGGDRPGPRTLTTWFNEKPTGAVVLAIRLLQERRAAATPERPVTFELKAGEAVSITVSKAGG